MQEIIMRKKGDLVNPISITSVETAVEVIRPLMNDEIDIRESVIVVYLNIRNQAIAYKTLSVGGIDQTTLDSRILFTGALLCGASSFILAHNHPSSDTEASQADLNITERILKMSEMMRIKMNDHIIITQNDHNSLRRSTDIWG